MAAKNTAAKTTKTAAAKPLLRKPQARVLEALQKFPKGLTRPLIAEKGAVDQAALVEYIGSPDPATRKANDAKHFPSLVTLQAVKEEQREIDGRNVTTYSITAKGKQLLAAFKKA
jgi:hypothetical protein